MAVVYSDDEIAVLIGECKPLPQGWNPKQRLRAKRGHLEHELEVKGESGNEFVVILRQGSNNIFDFSVILAVRVPESNRIFRLRRYNGRSHEHTNQIEGETFYDFHIHEATERYQDSGAREDAYAVVTDRYSDLVTAVSCLLEDANFKLPPQSQMQLI